MTYETQDVERSQLDHVCAERAGNGWTLVTAFVHPNQHENANPVIVTIWTRPA